MQLLFECKVTYMKPDTATGGEKKATEAYLFDALTYSEAEARAYQEMEQYLSGAFQISSVRKVKFSEVFTSDSGDKWYKVKVSFIQLDEKSGKEKRLNNMVLVLAEDVKDAVDKVVKEMGGDTPDFQVNQVMETPYMDYFPLFSKDDELKDKEVGRRPATEEELAANKQQ